VTFIQRRNRTTRLRSLDYFRLADYPFRTANSRRVARYAASERAQQT
jgi:hypothetical protein